MSTPDPMDEAADRWARKVDIKIRLLANEEISRVLEAMRQVAPYDPEERMFGVRLSVDARIKELREELTSDQ